ncbi:putative efflux protein, MATE family [Paenibacillus uliginis N3/975]|uniref:Probable multidrug resistance protein NorM n=1 Tax=Paenibacillus uliginis N3/975 TaxID=1313296 RepID=A0A1X7HDS1_9BACL|nr:MATE family efflux transporter [Paenibacillus uliginis]SMF84713.1 putative efflux protein, MATE family [Paenibacillus uliginis N3/975]
MKGTNDLTQGPIMPTLMKLTIPIIATNFISTTYGLVDMIWVGRLGSGPVAAIGTASFFINLAIALATMITIGTGIKVSHCMGAGQVEQARSYVKNGFVMSVVLGLLYMVFIVLTKDHLIGFFDLGSDEVELMAKQFLLISIMGIVFSILNTLYATILNAMGNSKQPFHIFSVGLILNIILDPFLIFGVGSFEGWGVAGAAIATLTANVLVTVLFIIQTRSSQFMSKSSVWDSHLMKQVIRMGLPITIQRVTFTIISIIIAKIIVRWGADAIAVQKVGIQIESISYMTIGGLQGAIAAFFGQNYGARQLDRIQQGYRKALLLTSIFGTFISLVFIIFPQQLFSLFLSDEASLKLGTDYMRIIGFSQLFMCMELMTVGAFNGIGKTHIPPIFSILFTALRIPLALILSEPFGLNGVWMSIALSSVFKGVILVFWFRKSLRNINVPQAIHL